MTRDHSEVAEALGRAARERGSYSERRVVSAVTQLAERADCRWIEGVRAATPAEDRQGIDVIVVTSHGPLYLQVKASRAGARRVGDRLTRRGIATVVAGPQMSDEQVSAEVRSALWLLRTRFGMDTRGGDC